MTAAPVAVGASEGTARRGGGWVRWLARTLLERGVVPAPARRAVRLAYLAGLERVHDRRQRRALADLAWRPLIRIVVPVRGERPAAVRASVASVLGQSYARWELYVVPDGGALPARLGGALGPADPRLTVWPDPPSGAPNAALGAAMGAPGADYVAVLDPGDTLTEHALYRVAELLNDDRDADVVYTDEQADGGRWRARPAARIYKPDWSPEHALAEPYVGRLCVYRRALVADVGGLGEEFDLAREYDLLLRLYERGARVAHVPAVVYRRAASSAAPAAAWREEVERAVVGHLRRVGADAECVAAAGGESHRVRYRVRGSPLVSIVVPTVGTTMRDIGGRTVDLLANTVQSIVERTEYRNFEIVYVHDRPLRPETLAVLAGSGVPVRGVPYDRPFNWSDKMNVGAAAAAGDHLLALNDDVEVLNGDWLAALLEFSQQDAVGAVGAKLYFPDGSIQHAGVVLNGGLPGHPYYGLPPAAQARVTELDVVRNCSAVTGACLMTRASVFREVGGFAPSFPLNYNDVDYCLRVRARGYRVVFTPHARLYHYEAISRGRIADPTGVPPAQREQFLRAWPDVVARDPYHDARRSWVWSG